MLNKLLPMMLAGEDVGLAFAGVETPDIVGDLCAHATSGIVTRAKASGGLVHAASASGGLVTRAVASVEAC